MPRPFDPKPLTGGLTLGDYAGHVVGFFGCGPFGKDDNPQFENDQFVPVETVVVFRRPVKSGVEEVVHGWRCFNAMRTQLVGQTAAIGLLTGKGRAGSPYALEPLPENDKGEEAYMHVFNTAIKEGWIADEARTPAPSASGKDVGVDDGF